LLSLSVLFLLLTPGGASGQEPEAVLARAERAVAAEAGAQAEAEGLALARDEASAEIRDLKMQDAWLDFQMIKYRRYLERQEAAIAELERRREEARRIAMELEPYLETVVDELEAHVARDLPFLPGERAGRIAFLRESLDDYHLDLGEKLRRVLEALQVEMEYGRTVETGSREIDLGGAPVRVATLRLGRTALYYLTEDGSGAGMWDRAAGGWHALGGGHARTLALARDMAERRRAVELLPLPLPLPGEVD
jgi:hypothetical protein